MFICDTNLETIINSHPYDYEQINEYNMGNIYKKTAIAQFQEEDGIIICLVENNIYFFVSDGSFKFKDNLPSEYTISDNYIMKIIIYKKENNYIYYFITFIGTQNYVNTLFILYYKVNIIENISENILINNKTFQPFYFDYPRIRIDGFHYSCQIMNSANKGKVLTCCFQTEVYKFIIIQSFLIDNDLEEIGEDIYV